MATNLFANRANAVVCKTFVPGPSIFTTGNLHIAYVTDNVLSSFVPDRPINGFTDFQVGKGYYIIPKVDLDYTAYFIAPLIGSHTREKLAEFRVGPGQPMVDGGSTYTNSLLVNAHGAEVLANGIQLPGSPFVGYRSVSLNPTTGIITFVGNVSADEVITIYKLTNL